MNALTLPAPLQNRIETMAAQFFAPANMPPIDFSEPKGAPALTAPDSVSWRVFKNPLTLFIGGVTAVLLELAEPRVRDGVWQNSSFRSDPLTRLQRTGLAAMMTVYGPKDQTERMIAGVVRMHDRVTGTTSEGIPYQANAQALLDWVQATASFGFITAYSAFAHALSAEEEDRAYAEAAPASFLYGARGAPGSRAALDAMFEGMKDRLVPSPIIFEFLDIMGRVDAFPGPARPFQHRLLKASVSLLPDWVRERIGLGPEWLPKGWERAAVKTAARAADRFMIRTSPPVQSSLRLGLPEDYLYR